jgi:hypothetical protein
MAERVGFEPTIPVKVCPLSRRIVSTAHAPLRRIQLSMASGRWPAKTRNPVRREPRTTNDERPTTNDQQLPTLPKKLLQNLRRTSCQHSTPYVHLMIQTGVIHHLQNRMDGACLRVVGSIHQPPDARMNCRSRAHGARLNCSKQFAVAQPVVTDVSSRLAQSYDLSVCGWILVGEVAIPSSSHHAPGAHHNGSHRHFARLQCALRTPEGFFHPELIRRTPDRRTLIGRSLFGGNLVSPMFLRGEQFQSPMASCQKASSRVLRSNSSPAD